MIFVIERRSLGLYLTNTCNRSCAFCFKKHSHPRPLQITTEDLNVFCSWAEQNDVESVIVAGGEPTTHPDFVSHVKTIRERIDLSMPLRVITNLLCDEEKLEAFTKTLMLVNADSLDQYKPSDLERFRRNLKIVSGQQNLISLSFTLWRLDQPEDYLLDYCEEFGLTSVRLDLSRASILKRNQHVTIAQLPAFKEKLLTVMRKLAARNIKAHIDCPLPDGTFTPEELAECKIKKCQSMDPLTHVCDAVYINPDLTISACPHQLLIDQRLDTFADYHQLRAAARHWKREKLKGPGVDLKKACLCEAERFL